MDKNKSTTWPFGLMVRLAPSPHRQQAEAILAGPAQSTPPIVDSMELLEELYTLAKEAGVMLSAVRRDRWDGVEKDTVYGMNEIDTALRHNMMILPTVEAVKEQRDMRRNDEQAAVILDEIFKCVRTNGVNAVIPDMVAGRWRFNDDKAQREAVRCIQKYRHVTNHEDGSVHLSALEVTALGVLLRDRCVAMSGDLGPGSKELLRRLNLLPEGE